MKITISHSMQDGTIATGDTREGKEALKAKGFRWSRNLGAWYLPSSRDRLPKTMTINDTKTHLERLGFDVELDIDRTISSTAEREANRAERVETRQDALTATSDKLAVESSVRYRAASAIADRIPFGQPILVGHHSERGARADQKRIAGHMDASCRAQTESADAARKAAASERTSAVRLTAPATIRRIDRIETELRDLARKLQDATEGTEWHERLTDRQTLLSDDLGYWKDHLASLTAEGVKLWSAADFEKGDVVRHTFGYSEVVRVNKKSLTVATGYSWTETVSYDRVKGRIAKADRPVELASL